MKLDTMPIYWAANRAQKNMHIISSKDLSKSFSIGNVPVRNRAILAPMSGVTDVPFRNLAWKFGAGMVVSEMVASQALMEGEAEMQLKLMQGDVSTHVVQLAGREPQWMALAAKLAEDNGADIIDINMGCPAKRVTTGYSGSALMRDLDHALTLIEATVKAVNIPVTLKTRLGWDDHSLNASELAQRAEMAGVKMITIHGRTRCQFYKGNADWAKVRAVRDATTLPLVVNGDIKSRSDADQALKESGADAVMIGRGAYGAPWLPAHIAGTMSDEACEACVSTSAMALSHHEAMLSFYGEASGIRQARKHLGWYFERLNLPKSSVAMKRRIMTSFDVKEVQSLIPELYAMHTRTEMVTPEGAAA